jgi:hypothetical protein
MTPPDFLKRVQENPQIAVELYEALHAYQAAEAMPTYVSASDFVWPKQSMRQEGNPTWGWICETHGLGYRSSCICCSEEYDRHQEQKTANARIARNDALYAAKVIAEKALNLANGFEQIAAHYSNQLKEEK